MATPTFSTSHRPTFHPRLLAPRYWGLWCGYALLALAWLLPRRIRGWVAGVLAALAMRIPSKRRARASANVDACFPDLDAPRRRALLARHARARCEIFLYYGELFFSSPRRLRSLVDVRGMHHVERAAADGHGIILLTPHSCAFEFGGLAVSMLHPVVSVARLHSDNALLDWIVTRTRLRFGAVIYSHRRSMLPLIKAVKAGRWMIYLPDEDRSTDNAVFVPFYGVMKHTVASLGRLVTACGARVIPLRIRFCLEARRIRLDFLDALEEFPSGEAQRDAHTMNQALESVINADPAQYDWTKRVFRSRPEGEPPIYR